MSDSDAFTATGRPADRPAPPAQADPFGHLLGHSEALAQAIARARAVAHVDSTVLITGESGVGKELIARGIHHSSARANAPFLAINCATLTESLQASELFGYARGAFTGALRDGTGPVCSRRHTVVPCFWTRWRNSLPRRRRRCCGCCRKGAM